MNENKILEMLGLNELAVRFPGTAKHFWYTEARSGRLPTVKAGKKYLVALPVAEAFLLGALEQPQPSQPGEGYGKIRRIGRAE